MASSVWVTLYNNVIALKRDQWKSSPEHRDGEVNEESKTQHQATVNFLIVFFLPYFSLSLLTFCFCSFFLLLQLGRFCVISFFWFQFDSASVLFARTIGSSKMGKYVLHRL